MQNARGPGVSRAERLSRLVIFRHSGSSDAVNSAKAVQRVAHPCECTVTCYSTSSRGS